MMDSIIEQYNVVKFEELSWCQSEGIMYQTDMSRSVDYGEDYFNKYISYEETQIAQRLNHGRKLITERYCNSILESLLKTAKLKLMDMTSTLLAYSGLKTEKYMKTHTSPCLM